MRNITIYSKLALFWAARALYCIELTILNGCHQYSKGWLLSSQSPARERGPT